MGGSHRCQHASVRIGSAALSVIVVLVVFFVVVVLVVFFVLVVLVVFFALMVKEANSEDVRDYHPSPLS